jgi:hypothetical protein
MKAMLQHYGNALHVYCRLCAFLPRTKAKAMANYWGHCWVYSLIY